MGLFFIPFMETQAAQSVFVTTNINVAITIDLNSSKINVEDTINTDATTSQNVTLVDNGNGTFSYTPPNDYQGIDSFTYTVNNVDPGTVTIRIGAIGSNLASPSAQAMGNTLDIICKNTNIMRDLCDDFFNATQGENAAPFLEQLAPKEIGGHNQITMTIASQKTDDIRRRMASLRQGMHGVDTSGLSFQRDNEQQPTSLAGIIDVNDSGGAASGDSSNTWKKLGVFASGNLGGGDHSKSENEDAYEFTTHGLTLGGDYRISDKAVAGGAIGQTNLAMEVAENGGDLDLNGFNLLGYGTYYFNSKTYAETIIARYWNSLDVKRNIFNPIQNSTSSALGSTDNQTLSVSFGGGYETFSQKGMTLNVSGNLDYILTAFDGYGESGAGDANLIIDKREENQLTSTVMMNFASSMSMTSGVLIPQVDLSWKHDFKGDATTITGTFKDDLSGSKFEFSTEKPDSDYFKAGAGFSYIIPGGNTGFVYWEKLFNRGNYSEYNISLGLRIELK